MKFLRVQLATVAVTLFVVVGCGSTGTAPTRAPGPTGAGPSPSLPTQTAGATSGGAPSADALCAAFTAELATAALGGAVGAPQSGDVVPRPSGVYCHYSLSGAAGTNVEAQLNQMTRAQFEQLAQTLGATTAVPGVGEAAFSRGSSSMGGGGSTVVAWSNGRGVTVVLNREGADQLVMDAAAKAIATAALAS